MKGDKAVQGNKAAQGNKVAQGNKAVQEYEAAKNAIHQRILSELDFSREIADEEVLDLIDEAIIREKREGCLHNIGPLSVKRMKAIRQELFHSIRRLDILQELLDDPGITEIMVNGPDNIFIERAGELQAVKTVFSSSEKLEDVIQEIVSSCNRIVNAASPIVDARLSNGARVNVILPPVALNGPILTIRRFPDRPITIGDLLRFGSISPEIADFLRKCVRAKLNIFVSGGTGSGKTTFLNVLSDFIPAGERIVTIEDSAELQLLHIPNIVRLEARNANVEGCAQVTIRDLIKASLRIRPDRIIVGEVRGPEAIDMIQAMNTGHDGSLSTGHANSAVDMLSRLETMVLMGMDLPLPAIRGQIAAGIDLIIHLGRLRDHSRKVLEVTEVMGAEGPDGKIALSTLYRFREKGEKNGRVEGNWEKVEELAHRGKFEMAGIAL